MSGLSPMARWVTAGTPTIWCRRGLTCPMTVLRSFMALTVSSADSADFAAFPNTAASYLPGEPGIDKFYVWKVARNCHGEQGCMEARIPPSNQVWMDACTPAVLSPTAPVRLGFRSYAEPATKVGPADSELIYDRVIVFRRR